MADEKNIYTFVLEKGTVLKSPEGEYEIKKVLGQGGFGITYQAKGIRKGDNIPHKYAIKEFFIKGQCWRDNNDSTMQYSPAAKAEIKACLKDFKDEALRLNKICRGNRFIVNVNEVFEANGTIYYVMEYLEGGSLRDKVRENGMGLSEGVALSYIRPIAEAVEYIHSQYHLLHCDIKPDNIILRLDEEGQPLEPVLIDFGISIHFSSKGELTTTHNDLGKTLGYCPPEQFHGLDTILKTRKKLHSEGYTNVPLIPYEMDVYALGATLFYLLTGTNPAPADTYRFENFVEKRLQECNVSEKTRNVILKSMQQAYMERTKTAAAFLKGFEDRYYLPRWYILKSPNAIYQIITDLEAETDNYLCYDAVIYTGGQQHGGGSSTLAYRYSVYECYVKGVFNRQADESLVSSDRRECEVVEDAFLKEMKSKVSLAEIGKKETNEVGLINREIFRANGTIYAIAKKRIKREKHFLCAIRGFAVGAVSFAKGLARGIVIMFKGISRWIIAIAKGGAKGVSFAASKINKSSKEVIDHERIEKKKRILKEDTITKIWKNNRRIAFLPLLLVFSCVIAFGLSYIRHKDYSQSYSQELFQAANSGDKLAQYWLGNCYHYGRGVSINSDEAFKWYMKSAVQGLDSAQLLVAKCYSNGEGTMQNFPKSMYWLGKALSQDNADAKSYLGDCYYYGNDLVKEDVVKAISLYEEAAKKGSAEGLKNLGYAYLYGTEVTPDTIKALQLFEKAEKTKAYTATQIISEFYNGEYGMKRDSLKSIRFLLAKLHNTKDTLSIRNTCVNIARFYRTGDGQNKYFGEAFKWYLKAAKLGSPSSMWWVGLYYMWGDNGIKEDPNKAFQWMYKCANINEIPWKGKNIRDVNRQFNNASFDTRCIALAQQQIAEWYKQGYGVETSMYKYIYWLRLSAQNGSKEAQHWLGDEYYEGSEYLKKNIREAYDWFEIATENGDNEACVHIAFAYFEGKDGYSQDNEKGIEYMELGSNRKGALATYNMGIFYYNGDYGLKVDKIKAKQYLLKAKELGYKNAEAALNDLF